MNKEISIGRKVKALGAASVIVLGSTFGAFARGDGGATQGSSAPACCDTTAPGPSPAPAGTSSPNAIQTLICPENPHGGRRTANGYAVDGVQFLLTDGNGFSSHNVVKTFTTTTDLHFTPAGYQQMLLNHRLGAVGNLKSIDELAGIAFESGGHLIDGSRLAVVINGSSIKANEIEENKVFSHVLGQEVPQWVLDCDLTRLQNYMTFKGNAPAPAAPGAGG